MNVKSDQLYFYLVKNFNYKWKVGSFLFTKKESRKLHKVTVKREKNINGENRIYSHTFIMKREKYIGNGKDN